MGIFFQTDEKEKFKKNFLSSGPPYSSLLSILYTQTVACITYKCPAHLIGSIVLLLGILRTRQREGLGVHVVIHHLVDIKQSVQLTAGLAIIIILSEI